MDRLVLVLLGLCFGYGSATTAEAVDSVDQQLDALTNRLVSLSGELDKILSDGTDSNIQAVRFSRTLDRYQGKNGACLRGFFPCGYGADGAVQCIRDYLVCDGSADCKSGADEAPEICQGMPFGDPVDIKGRIVYDTCIVGLSADIKAERYSIWTPRAEIIPWFPSRPVIISDTIAPVFSNTARSDFFVPSRLAVYDYATGDLLAPFDNTYGIYGDLFVERMAEDKLRFTGSGRRQFQEGKPCSLSIFALQTGQTSALA